MGRRRRYSSPRKEKKNEGYIQLYPLNEKGEIIKSEADWVMYGHPLTKQQEALVNKYIPNFVETMRSIHRQCMLSYKREKHVCIDGKTIIKPGKQATMKANSDCRLIFRSFMDYIDGTYDYDVDSENDLSDDAGWGSNCSSEEVSFVSENEEWTERKEEKKRVQEQIRKLPAPGYVEPGSRLLKPETPQHHLRGLHKRIVIRAYEKSCSTEDRLAQELAKKGIPMKLTLADVITIKDISSFDPATKELLNQYIKLFEKLEREVGEHKNESNRDDHERPQQTSKQQLAEQSIPNQAASGAFSPKRQISPFLQLLQELTEAESGTMAEIDMHPPQMRLSKEFRIQAAELRNARDVSGAAAAFNPRHSTSELARRSFRTGAGHLRASGRTSPSQRYNGSEVAGVSSLGKEYQIEINNLEQHMGRHMLILRQLLLLSELGEEDTKTLTGQLECLNDVCLADNNLLLRRVFHTLDEDTTSHSSMRADDRVILEQLRSLLMAYTGEPVVRAIRDAYVAFVGDVEVTNNDDDDDDDDNDTDDDDNDTDDDDNDTDDDDNDNDDDDNDNDNDDDDNDNDNDDDDNDDVNYVSFDGDSDALWFGF